jgi:hypothetical protein
MNWDASGIETLQRAESDQLSRQLLEFRFRAIAPIDAIRLGQGGDIAHPVDQTLMPGRGRIETRN